MMDPELVEVISEEFDECETLEELEAMVRYGHGYTDPDVAVAVARNRKRLAPSARELEIARLEAELAKLRGQAPAAAPAVAPVLARVVKPIVRKSRSGRKYKLLSTDVSWTTTPQVLAIAAILARHYQVGDVMDEQDVCNMMEANRKVLSDTKQTGTRLWLYYRGRHERGLEEHGNIVRVTS